MLSLARLSAVLAFLWFSACGGSGGGGDGGGGPPPPTPRRFLHVATAANLDGSSTDIDHASVNGDPAARIVVTHVLDPDGDGAGIVENVHPIGIGYGAASGVWSIFNQDGVAMPVGSAFFVTAAGPDVVSLVHTATAANITNNYTRIDDASAGDAAATLFVTQHANAVGPVVPNPSEIGVYRLSGTWRIFNQDAAAAMPPGADFVVLRPTLNSFVHHATIGNSVLDFTYLGHPLLDDRPSALVHVAQNWNPDDAGVYNDHTIAVHYRDAEGLWTIVNVDGSAIPVGASFNVWAR